MDEVLAEFITETKDYLDVLDRDLIALQKDPTDRALIHEIFRAVHTIKSGCGFANLPGIESVAHDAENILMRMRDGMEKTTPENISLVSRALQIIRTTVESLGHASLTDIYELRPIEDAWRVLPAIIADLEQKLGKSIIFEAKPSDVTIDSRLLPIVKACLTHIVRNAADHGIEQNGRIKIEAHHKDGFVVIEVSDNGKGLSLPAIKKKIAQQGLATDAQTVAMQPQQAFSYIFKPGFSTAPETTLVSGSGVGLDAVYTALDKLGGNIIVSSVEGQGCRFIMSIPENLPMPLAVPGLQDTIGQTGEK